MPDEVVALVDEQDTEIGQKRRGDLLNEDCWRMVSIWIENDKGQVLLQQRVATKPIDPNCWTPAAEGTVTIGDDYDETAVREAEEEIGLVDHPLQKVGKVYAQFQFGKRQFQGYKTVCNWPIEQFKLQTEEVAKLEWADKAQVIAEITGKAEPTRTWPTSAKYWPGAFNLV